jgi:large subunit ribosomal protein L13
VDTLSYKTVSANKSTVKKQWLLIDAKGHSLGRMASIAAKMLRGKHKPDFTPHVDCGDNVIITNATKVNLTGKKWSEKEYIRHTNFPGGQRSLTAKQIFEKNPNRLVEKAVQGMLPKNRLGSELFRNLRVFETEEHNMEATKPKEINLNELV